MSTRKPWKIIPRPLLETVLNNHAQHHRVHQPLILHGPRGVGKTTLVLSRLLDSWNKGPHLTGYVDFSQAIKTHHPSHNESFPWSSWSHSSPSPPPPLSLLQSHLEKCLEAMAERAISMGSITSSQVYAALTKWHSVETVLRRVVGREKRVVKRGGKAALWERAVLEYGKRVGEEIGEVGGKAVSAEERAYMREAVVALRLAKEVVKVQQGWRGNAVREMNRKGGFSRSLVHSATDWPCLLIELLSAASEMDHFQVDY